MHTTIIATGAINAFIATACGAFAAHVLKGNISEHYLGVFHTAADYHMYHALGLILIGLIHMHRPEKLLAVSAWLMLAGILLFSGSLYTLAISGVTWLGMITPLGGLCFLAAWLLLAISQLRLYKAE